MSLTGANRKCLSCTQLCKQWKEVKVILCPNFIFNGKTKKDVPIKHEEIVQSPSTGRNTKDSGWIRQGVA